MAESSRKTGSASSCFSEKGRAEKPGNKEHRKKHDKSNDKKLLLVIGFLIIDILLLVCFGRIEKYASDNLCESIFWDFFGDSQIQLFAVVGIEGIITVAIALSKKIKKKLTIFFLLCFLFLFIDLGIFDLCSYAKVKAEVLERKEEKALNDFNVQSVQEVQIVVISYYVNQDPFMNKIPLEQYYGKAVVEEKREEIMVEILCNNLENNIPKGNKSENFTKYQEIADAEYDTYLYEKDRDVDSDMEELLNDRLERLQRSLDNRKKANAEYETPDNERPIAAGYRDKGDEYFGQGDQEQAYEAYEESAEWYMKAIYHAIVVEDEDEIIVCMRDFKKMGKEVEKLDQISDDRKKVISMMISVYQKTIDACQLL